MIQRVRVEDAVGLVLAHDITRVVPGFKGPAFRRGQVIRKEDIPALLDLGKEHVFVLRLEEGEVHEEEAAIRIAAAVMGENLERSMPSEGRVNLMAARRGVLKVDAEALYRINSVPDVMIATLHDGTVCNKGMPVAGMRIIPLYIRQEKLAQVESIASQPVISLRPFKLNRIGLVITGNEVAKGRIQDRFSPTIRAKLKKFDCSVVSETIVPDDPDRIADAIKEARAKGSEIILCCSGMSVDPDDVTPQGIRASGAEMRFYGLPVLPGAMFMYARLGDTHVLGVPACVLHSPTTAFERLFPALLTDEELTFEGTRKLGHGGLCLNCERCTYPVCPFCKA